MICCWILWSLSAMSFVQGCHITLPMENLRRHSHHLVTSRKVFLISTCLRFLKWSKCFLSYNWCLVEFVRHHLWVTFVCIFLSSVRLIRDGTTKRPKGYGFIAYASQAEAMRAVEAMDGRVWLLYRIVLLFLVVIWFFCLFEEFSLLCKYYFESSLARHNEFSSSSCTLFDYSLHYMEF